MLALADCNNFYASCERLFQPSLRDKPVVVLSNNDGCIIARSNEAKAIGIKMGEPAFKIKHLIKENNIHVFSTNKNSIFFNICSYFSQNFMFPEWCFIGIFNLTLSKR